MTAKKILIHIGLFLLTMVTTTVCGIEFSTNYNMFDYTWAEFFAWSNIKIGLVYSCCFVGILTVHEFGHYLTAKYHKTKVTLPYYIPMYLPGFLNIGTMGAFIRIKSRLRTRSEFFDVGVAGPLAGFVVALLVIWYGFEHLPPTDHIYNIHPEYQAIHEEFGIESDTMYTYEYQKAQWLEAQLAKDPEFDGEAPEEFAGIYLGDNLLLAFFRWVYQDKTHQIPNLHELMHYPYLFAGFLACFFTALNLIPIGQLDGGHVLYGLLGHKRFNKIAPYFFMLFVFYAGLGIVSPHWFTDGINEWSGVYIIFLFMIFSKIFPDLKQRSFYIFVIVATQFIFVFLFPEADGYYGYLLFAFIIGRFLGVFHPPSLVEEEMNMSRKIIGIIAILVFIVCFCPTPFVQG